MIAHYRQFTQHDNANVINLFNQLYKEDPGGQCQKAFRKFRLYDILHF